MQFITEENKRNLAAILNAFGPTSFVRMAQETFAKQLMPYVEHVEIDRVDNLFAHIKGNPDRKPIMLFAHMDTIGFQVHHVADEGVAFVQDITSLDAFRFDQLAGNAVQLYSSKKGMIIPLRFTNPLSIHHEHREIDPASFKENLFYIPLIGGFRDGRDARRVISVADYAALSPESTFHENGRLESGGLDDRIGVYALLRVAQKLARKPTYDRPPVFIHTTTAEECAMGLAQSGMNHREYEAAINIDVTPATDLLAVSTNDVEIKLRFGNVFLEQGPVLARGPGVTEPIFSQLKTIAAKYGIPTQFEMANTATENVYSARASIPSGLVSIPCRHLHTNHETVDMHDVEQTADLLTRFVMESKPLVSKQYRRK